MEKRHPIIILIYFLAVILLTVCCLNPWITLLSFFGGFGFWFLLEGKKAFKTLLALLPFAILASLFNPLFNHQGVTILFYLFGNPITLEALLYGFCAAGMLIATLFWCFCFNRLFGSDKLAALLGKRFPRLCMFLSLVFYFIPRLNARLRQIHEAKKGIGEDAAGQGLKGRLKYGTQLISSLLDRELEQSLDRAASMRARGYALTPRSSFTSFRFGRSDLLFLLLFVLIAALLLLGHRLLSAQFFPLIRIAAPDFWLLLTLSAFFLLPAILHLYEVMKWKSLAARL
ncbi:MAG: hypothetical protein IJP33_04770 [Firmicutes bacterium]|nr:hypothetical protein [Bacillota bacterium]